MKNFVLFGCLLAGLAALPLLTQAQSSSDLENLAQYRGTNRLLLVFAPSKISPHWQAQNMLLKGSAAAFKNRNLLRFDCIGGGTTAEALRTRYRVKDNEFRVLLIGKDGHVASSSTQPIKLGDLNAKIDQMPMRRDEMRQQRR